MEHDIVLKRQKWRRKKKKKMIVGESREWTNRARGIMEFLNP